MLGKDCLLFTAEPVLTVSPDWGDPSLGDKATESNYEIERRDCSCLRVSNRDASGSFAPLVPEPMRRATRELAESRIDMSQSVPWRPSWHAALATGEYDGNVEQAAWKISLWTSGFVWRDCMDEEIAQH